MLLRLLFSRKHPACGRSLPTKATTATLCAPRSPSAGPGRSFPTKNRVIRHRFDRRAYKGRNVIERSFCRLKDFRRIATRYDKLARNFFAAVQLAALVAYWLN